MDQVRRQSLDGGLCFLALDSSEPGTTELSELVLLQELMSLLEYDAKLGRTPLPWEYFDLIGGSGMGGVFALMLAVWRLSVDETIAAYLTLRNEVFTSESWSNFDIEASSQLFDITIRKIAASFDKNPDESLVSGSVDGCKAFVCTINPANMTLPRLFRTYNARSNRAPASSVAVAIAASVAGHPHVKPVTLGQPLKEEFISAAHRISNPSFEVLREAQDVFRPPHDVHVACIVSIGAGQKEPLETDSRGLMTPEIFERIARETLAVDEELERRFSGINGLFCRFNVMHGLEKVAQTSETLSAVTAHTKQYLTLEVVRKKLDALVVALLERPKQVTLSRMNSVIGPDGHEFAKSIKLHSALSYLPYVDGASYKSDSGCLENTRLELLSKIRVWIESAQSTSSAEVLLLYGVAGAGKSAVAHSVAKSADESGLLASSFFFQSGTEGRDSTRALLSTMIRDLAGRFQGFGDAVGATIDADRPLASADLQRQFEKLLLPCLHKLPNDKPTVVVIDALDELSNEIESRQFLRILRSRIPELPGSFRIFVTSRRLDSIDRALAPNVPHIRTEIIDTQSSSNRADLKIFVQSSLRDVAEERFLQDWPNAKAVGLLVSKAEGLFIWASVVINLLRFKAISPVRVLNDIPDNSRSGLSPKSKMDEMYAKTLEICGKWDDQYFCEGYKAVMGTIIAAQSPVSLATMQSLYRRKAELAEIFPDILLCISPLLVGFDKDHDQNNKPLNVLHLSFREFVTGDSQSTLLRDQFRVSLIVQHEQLAKSCLQILNDDLNDSTPGVGLLNLEQEGIPLFDFSQVSEALLYSSQHWKSHFMEITQVFSAQVCQSLMKFTTGRRLKDWIEFVTCSTGFQKVTDLIGTIKAGRWHCSLNGILDSLESAKLAKSLLTLADNLKYMNRLEEALSAVEDVVEIYRPLANTRPAAFNPDLVISLANFSLRLSDLGRHEDALKSIEEAVGIYRSLAAAQSEALNPDLAVLLNILSTLLSVLGRREDALKALEEAVAIRRPLAAARPDEFNIDLAMLLNNLSTRLLDLGRHEDALKAIEEAVAIRLPLAIAQPDVFRPDLARLLNNFSIRLSDFGWHEAALKTIETTVIIYRRFAIARPDAFSADLALSLDNFSTYLSNLGRRDDALTAIEEAVLIRRSLAAARPDAFNPDLAQSLNNFSIRLSDQGKREDALKAVEESVVIRRSLAAARPDAFSLGLAVSLNNLSARLSDIGCREGAVKALEEAVAIRRSFAAARPVGFNLDLAELLSNFSLRLSDLGHHEDALKAVREAADIYNSLVTARRDTINPGQLGRSFHSFSACLSSLGQHENALIAIEEAVFIRRVNAALRSDPFSLELAASLNNLSIRLSDLGRLEDALKAIEEAVSIRRPLATARPDAFNPDLAVSLNNLSTRLSDLGRREDALKTIEEAVVIYRSLSATRPDLFNPELAGSLNNFSLRLLDLGRHEDALKAIEEAVSIRGSLAAARPEAFNRDLARSLNNSSDCLAIVGRFEEAFQAVEKAIEILWPLAAARPDKLNSELAAYCITMSERYGEFCRWDEALASIDESIRLFRPFAEKNPETFKRSMTAAHSQRSRCLREMEVEGKASMAPKQSEGSSVS